MQKSQRYGFWGRSIGVLGCLRPCHKERGGGLERLSKAQRGAKKEGLRGDEGKRAGSGREEGSRRPDKAPGGKGKKKGACGKKYKKKKKKGGEGKERERRPIQGEGKADLSVLRATGGEGNKQE